MGEFQNIEEALEGRMNDDGKYLGPAARVASSSLIMV